MLYDIKYTLSTGEGQIKGLSPVGALDFIRRKSTFDFKKIEVKRIGCGETLTITSLAKYPERSFAFTGPWEDIKQRRLAIKIYGYTAKTTEVVERGNSFYTEYSIWDGLRRILKGTATGNTLENLASNIRFSARQKLHELE